MMIIGLVIGIICIIIALYFGFRSATQKEVQEIHKEVNEIKEILQTQPFQDDIANHISPSETIIGRVKKADLLLHKGEYKKAQKLYKDVYKRVSPFKKNKLLGLLLMGQGVSIGSQGNHLKAIKIFKKAIDYEDYMDPKVKSKLFYNIGLSYQYLERSDWSIEYYTKAVELDPEDILAYNNRGNAFFTKGQYKLAIEDYNRALELNPNFAGAYNNRGNVYYRIKIYDRSIKDYNKALELNPDYYKAYSNRGLTYADKGEYELAIEDYNKALKLNPEYTIAYNNRGALYGKKGEYEWAIQDFDRAVKLNREYERAYNNRGIVYYEMGEYDRAIHDFDKALEVNPKFADVYINRGNVYAKKHEYERAVEDYNKALDLNPKSAEAYYNKAITCEETGKIRNAIEAYESFIQYALSPDTQQMRYAKKRIKKLEEKLSN